MHYALNPQLAMVLKMIGGVLMVDAFFIALPYIRRALGLALSFFGMVVMATIATLFLQSLPTLYLSIGTGIAVAGYVGGRWLTFYLMKKRQTKTSPPSPQKDPA